MALPSPGDQEPLASFLQTLADESCQKRLTGIAIGVIAGGQEWSAVSGWADVDSKKPVSESTIFEIGSLSKLFTSLLFAVAATKHEIALDDPVQSALGDAVKLPTDGKSQITYRSLANHRSSLPKLPDDLLKTGDPENPYAHYDQAMLYACLNRMKSVKPIGSRAAYSNLGVGLLGHVLGKLAGSDYRTALKEKVLIPLGLPGVSSGLDEAHTAELATAYKKKNTRAKHWDFTEVTVAAGGLRASLQQMLKFLRVNLYPAKTAMADALTQMQAPSNLPECEASSNRNGSLRAPIVYVTVLAVVMLWMHGSRWLTEFAPGGFPAFLIMLLPAIAVSRWKGRIAGVTTLILATIATWIGGTHLAGQSQPQPQSGIATAVIFIWGAIFILSPVWNQFDPTRLRGDGLLAWQNVALGKHEVLWHNGMTGGSASFLGIVPELETGVVILTNTAKSVDLLGLKILSQLINRK